MKTQILGKTSPLLIALALVFAAGACEKGVDLNLNLIDPCDKPVLYDNNQCQLVQVVISSLDPQDPLHCAQTCLNCGPVARTCNIADGACKISGDDLLGLARLVDVLCYTTVNAGPVARATSQAMFFGEGGIGGKALRLLIGDINGFAATTLLDSNVQAEIGSCSMMGAGEIGRYGHASVLLDDGRVLITGGIRRIGQANEILASVEIFDPVTGAHSLVLNKDGSPVSMRSTSGRAYHTASRLRDGRILLSGGIGLVESKLSALRSSEIFDPKTLTFPEAGVAVMGVGRAHHVATGLATGEILVTGGASYNNNTINTYFETAELYDPTNNSWVPVGSMSKARAFHQAIAQDPDTYSGNVVVIGGENNAGPLNSIDIYNTAGKTFYQNVNVVMGKNRSHACAVAINNGEILVTGGKTTVDDTSVDAGVEIYNPAKPEFGEFRTQTLNMQVARMDHTCTLLSTGNVLLAGGRAGNGQGLGTGEQVLVGSGTYSIQPIDDPIDPARYGHTATKLRNGWVYLAGGLTSASPDAAPIAQSLYFVAKPACE